MQGETQLSSHPSVGLSSVMSSMAALTEEALLALDGTDFSIVGAKCIFSHICCLL